MHTLAIVGSRNFDNYKYLIEKLSEIDLSQVNSFVSGGAKGADSLGMIWAERQGYIITIHKPDWKKYGRAAGVIRNSYIVRDADIIVAFPSRTGKGTQDTIKKAQESGKILYVFWSWEEN